MADYDDGGVTLDHSAYLDSAERLEPVEVTVDERLIHDAAWAMDQLSPGLDPRFRKLAIQILVGRARVGMVGRSTFYLLNDGVVDALNVALDIWRSARNMQSIGWALINGRVFDLLDDVPLVPTPPHDAEEVMVGVSRNRGRPAVPVGEEPAGFQ